MVFDPIICNRRCPGSFRSRRSAEAQRAFEAAGFLAVVRAYSEVSEVEPECWQRVVVRYEVEDGLMRAA